MPEEEEEEEEKGEENVISMLPSDTIADCSPNFSTLPKLRTAIPRSTTVAYVLQPPSRSALVEHDADPIEFIAVLSPW